MARMSYDGICVRSGIDRTHARALPSVGHRGHGTVQFIDEVDDVVVRVKALGLEIPLSNLRANEQID
jgi:hypothetical protein